MNFDHIILEPEQQDLFIQMVENVRSVPRKNRSRLIEANSLDGTCLIMPKGEIKGYAHGDPEALASEGLLHMDYGSRGSNRYTISPVGYQYYDWLMKQQGKPVERIEKEVFRYFEFEGFKKHHSDAYEKLKLAEELLWSSDSGKNFSAIGHYCREAMQEFAATLYEQVFGEPSDEPKASTVKRIREIIEAKSTESGKTVKAYLEALLSYWGTVSDLVQRQEHAGQKEGEPINWEDTRRVVFQTANVMFELHRTFKDS